MRNYRLKHLRLKRKNVILKKRLPASFLKLTASFKVCQIHRNYYYDLHLKSAENTCWMEFIYRCIFEMVMHNYDLRYEPMVTITQMFTADLIAIVCPFFVFWNILSLYILQALDRREAAVKRRSNQKYKQEFSLLPESKIVNVKFRHYSFKCLMFVFYIPEFDDVTLCALQLFIGGKWQSQRIFEVLQSKNLRNYFTHEQMDVIVFGMSKNFDFLWPLKK